MRSASRSLCLKAALAGSLACGAMADAGVIHVDAGVVSPGNGSSWSSAYRSLSAAIAAAGPGDELWVAQGTYRPEPTAGMESPRLATFLLPANIALYGGFAGSEASRDQRDPQAHPTILSGDLNADDGPNFSNRADNAYHVVCAFVGAPVLDGFIVEDGYADGVSLGATTLSHDQGSGLNVYDAFPTVRNVRFRGNWAINHGTVNDHGSGTFTDCVFEGNYADHHGAGLYAHHHSMTRATRCRFEGNQTPGDGGGVYIASMHEARVESCVMVGNRAGRGAGMYAATDANPLVTDCTFEDNRAVLGGGGMYNDFAFSTIRRNAFRGNRAGEAVAGGGAGIGGSGGGGVWASGGEIHVEDCTFERNVASFGGGAYHNEDSHGVVLRCDFRDNLATEAGGLYILGSPVLADQCTFVRNTAQGSDFSVGGAVSSYFSNNRVQRCVFIGNQADLGGGGHYAEGEAPIIDRCVFIGNRAVSHEPGWGGGLLNGYHTLATISNCLIVGNQADVGGGAYTMVFADPMIVNCTIVANTSLAPGGAVYSSTPGSTRVVNCISRANTPDELAGSAAAAHSCLASAFAGEGNLAVDPRFKRLPSPGVDGLWGTDDDDGGDLRLDASSPCIDAGDSAAVPAFAALDLDDHPRRSDDPGTPDAGVGPAPVVDMGAFELSPPHCPADLDDDGSFATGSTPDGSVTIDDLLYFLAAFEAGDAHADLDDGGGLGLPDQAVTVDDLVYFLRRFEQGC